MTADDQRHAQITLDQFTRQAEPFGDMPGHSEPRTLATIVAAGGAGPGDRVLDVACGPGLVSCALARTGASVTGVDVTPAMVDRARRRQADEGLENMAWDVADARDLPFGDGTFDVVTTRYSLHHVLDPARVVGEMVRVCRPGGTVVVVDAYTAEEPDKADAYNRVEKLRDPSHVRALSLTELAGLGEGSGLTGVRLEPYRMEVELETQLRASFPEPGDDETIRAILHDDVGVDRTTMAAHLVDGVLYFSYPSVIIVGTR